MLLDSAVGLDVASEIFRTFSASLPAVLNLPARPWNGRLLSAAERRGAFVAAEREFSASRSYWFAAQAAHEWLSREAW